MPFKNFDEVYEAYQKVIVGTTTLDELAALGFDLRRVSGSVEWNPNRVRKFLLLFSENLQVQVEYLEAEAQTCLKTHGHALEFTIPFIKIQTPDGFGNFVKREVGFRTERETVGAKLWTWFCFDPEKRLVVYKLADPQPFIKDPKVEIDEFAPWRKAILGALAALILLF